MVAIVPVATFYSLAASLASLVGLAYLTDNTSHLHAPVALEIKQLEDIPKLFGKLNV